MQASLDPALQRTSNRQLNTATRQLSREVKRLETQEKEIAQKMKAAAQANDQSSLRIYARSLIRTRKTRQRVVHAIAQMHGIRLGLTSARSAAQLQSAVSTAGSVLARMNQGTSVAGTQAVCRQFTHAATTAANTESMCCDAIDEAMGVEDSGEDDSEGAELARRFLDAALLDAVAGTDAPGKAKKRTTTVGEEVQLELYNTAGDLDDSE